jgi:hypothetical protein
MIAQWMMAAARYEDRANRLVASGTTDVGKLNSLVALLRAVPAAVTVTANVDLRALYAALVSRSIESYRNSIPSESDRDVFEEEIEEAELEQVEGLSSDADVATHIASISRHSAKLGGLEDGKELAAAAAQVLAWVRADVAGLKKSVKLTARRVDYREVGATEEILAAARADAAREIQDAKDKAREELNSLRVEFEARIAEARAFSEGKGKKVVTAEDVKETEAERDLRMHEEMAEREAQREEEMRHLREADARAVAEARAMFGYDGGEGPSGTAEGQLPQVDPSGGVEVETAAEAELAASGASMEGLSLYQRARALAIAEGRDPNNVPVIMPSKMVIGADDASDFWEILEEAGPGMFFQYVADRPPVYKVACEIIGEDNRYKAYEKATESKAVWMDFVRTLAARVDVSDYDAMDDSSFPEVEWDAGMGEWVD